MKKYKLEGPDTYDEKGLRISYFHFSSIHTNSLETVNVKASSSDHISNSGQFDTRQASITFLRMNT